MSTPPSTPAVDELELPAAMYAAHDAEQARLAAGDVDDFDAFWQQINPVKPAKIRGIIVTPPTDVPLSVLTRLEQIEGSSDLAAIQELLSHSYGRDVVAEWSAAGMGLREFQLVMAWTGAAMRGTPVTFEKARELAAEAIEQAEQGKAQGNSRAERRSRKKSGASGS